MTDAEQAIMAAEEVDALLNRGIFVNGVVLVHGLYHDPQHFALVVGELAAAGVEVVVPELHRGSLLADTEAVQVAVDAMGEPPLVGPLLRRVSHHRPNGHCPFGLLAAFVPAEGESAARLGGSTKLLASSIVHDGDGLTHVDSAAAVKVFYAYAPTERATWAASLLRPQKPGCGRGVPKRQSWRNTPSTYVLCTQDRAIDPDLQREMSRRCSSAFTWHTSHLPFISQPAESPPYYAACSFPAAGTRSDRSRKLSQSPSRGSVCPPVRAAVTDLEARECSGEIAGRAMRGASLVVPAGRQPGAWPGESGSDLGQYLAEEVEGSCTSRHSRRGSRPAGVGELLCDGEDPVVVLGGKHEDEPYVVADAGALGGPPAKPWARYAAVPCSWCCTENGHGRIYWLVLGISTMITITPLITGFRKRPHCKDAESYQHEPAD